MPKTSSEPLTITITEDAAKHVRGFASQETEAEVNLRVGVKGGGCSGMTYVLDVVDDGPKEGDKVIDQYGIKLIVDWKSYVFLAGTTLEYSGGLNGKGFVFNNPNAKTTCGCGTSFSV